MFNDNFDNTADQNNDNLQLNESQPSLIQFPSIVSPYFATSWQNTTENGFEKGSAVCTGGGPLAQFIIHAMPADQGIGPITASEINNSIRKSMELAALNCEHLPKDKQPTIIFPLICGGIFSERVAKDIKLGQLIMRTATLYNNYISKPLNLMFVDFGKDTDFADEYNANKEMYSSAYYKSSNYTIEVKNGDIFEILKNNPQQYILVNPYHSNVDKSYGQFLSNGGLTKSIINEVNQYNVILANKEVKTAAECIYNYIYNQYEVLEKHVKDETAQYLNPKFEKITFLGGVYNFIKDAYLKIINAFTAIFTFIRNTVFSQATENTNDDSQVTEENKSETSTGSRRESQDSYDSNNSNDSKIDLQRVYQLDRASAIHKTPLVPSFYTSINRSNSSASQQSLQDDRDFAIDDKLKCNNTSSTIYLACTEHEKSQIEDNSDDVSPLDNETANVLSNTTNLVDLRAIPGDGLLNEVDNSTINKSATNTLKNT